MVCCKYNVSCPVHSTLQIADDEKIDSLQLEVCRVTERVVWSRLNRLFLSQYTYLLTSQLESQRLFFEEKLLRVEEEANDKVSLVSGRGRCLKHTIIVLGEAETFICTEFSYDNQGMQKQVLWYQLKIGNFCRSFNQMLRSSSSGQRWRSVVEVVPASEDWLLNILLVIHWHWWYLPNGLHVLNWALVSE